MELFAGTTFGLSFSSDFCFFGTIGIFGFTPGGKESFSLRNGESVSMGGEDVVRGGTYSFVHDFAMLIHDLH